MITELPKRVVKFEVSIKIEHLQCIVLLELIMYYEEFLDDVKNMASQCTGLERWYFASICGNIC